MIEFDNAYKVVMYYSAYGFMLSVVIYIFVVLGGMALRLLRFGQSFDLSK